MSNQRFCDGIRRRDMLRFGAAGAFGMGITLPSLLEHEARLKANGVDPSQSLQHGIFTEQRFGRLKWICLSGQRL